MTTDSLFDGSDAHLLGGCATEDDICSGCGTCGKGEVEALEKEGHTYHCAARIVWGDGQCECKPSP